MSLLGYSFNDLRRSIRAIGTALFWLFLALQLFLNLLLPCGPAGDMCTQRTLLLAVKQMHVVVSVGIVFLLGATSWRNEFA